MELDEKALPSGKKTAAHHPDAGRRICDGSFLLQKQAVDVSQWMESLHRCIEEYDLEAREAAQVALNRSKIEEENLWKSYRKDRRQLEEEFEQDKVS